MASGIIEKIRKFLAMESDELELDANESVEYQSMAEKSKSYVTEEPTRRRSAPGTSGMVKQEIVVFQPGAFNEAPQIAEHIKARKTVIINMKRTDKDLGKRIIDFLSGINYAVDGNYQKIADTIFIFSPSHIEITMANDIDSMPGDETLFGR